MNLLSFVWWSSAALAISAMLGFSALVLRRFRAEKREEFESSIRRAVQNLLFRYMDDDASQQEYMDELLGLNKLEKRLLRQVAVGLSNLIQGHERDQIAKLLGQIGFRDSCIEALAEEDIKDRLSAIAALQLFPDPKSKKALSELIDDEDDSIRIAAIGSLNHIGALPKANILVAKLSTDSILQSRDLRTLLRHIARQSPDYLSKIAKFKGLNRLLKVAMADAMSEAADFSVLGDLFAYAQDTDLDIRTTAIRSLGALQHPSAEPYIVQALQDDKWQVRAGAAQASGLIGLPLTIPTLSQMLDDDSWWVRFRSAESLACLGDLGLEALKTRASQVLSPNNSGGRIAALLLEEQTVDALNELPDGVAHA